MDLKAQNFPHTTRNFSFEYLFIVFFETIKMLNSGFSRKKTSKNFKEKLDDISKLF